MSGEHEGAPGDDWPPRKARPDAAHIINHIIWNIGRPWGGAAWETPFKMNRVVRYRRSPNGAYQQVVLQENGHFFYGFYMPEGFAPPAGTEN